MANSLNFGTNNELNSGAMLATWNAALGNTYLTEAAGMATPGAAAQVMINAMNPTDTATPAALAAKIVSNLGISTANVTAATGALTSAFTAAGGIANWGSALTTILTTFSGMGTNATFGADANAYNARVQSALTFSLNAANTTTNLVALQNAAVMSAGNVINLDTGLDVGLNFTATAPNTTFKAGLVGNANTFNSGDVLTGVGTGNVVDAVLGNASAFAIQVTTNNIQEARFEAQASAVDSASNNVAMSSYAAQVDAQNMPAVTTWVDNNSRADLTLERIQLNSATATTNSLTFVMRNTDAGSLNTNTSTNGSSNATNGTSNAVVATNAGVSFNSFLDPQSLRKGAITTNGPVTIEVGSTLSAAQGAVAATPLLNMPYTAFTFKDNGTLVTIPLTTLTTGTPAVPVPGQPVVGAKEGATAVTADATLVSKVATDYAAVRAGGTQAQMQTLVQDAIAAYNSANGTTYSVATNAVAFTSSTGVSSDSYIHGVAVSTTTPAYTYTDSAGAAQTTNTYTISTAGHTLTPGTWVAANGFPTSNAFEASMALTSSSNSTLIGANVVLDHVGGGSMLQDPTYIGSAGSAGGNMIVGSMATSGGVQQFNVQVQNGSWINSLSSTNNTLQVVNISGTSVASPITTTMANSQTANQYLIIGAAIQPSVNTNNLYGWQTHGNFVNVNGLTDVQTVDASGNNGQVGSGTSTAYTGSLMIGEAITAASLDKYLVHSLSTVNFSTTLGNNTTGVTLPVQTGSLNSAASSPTSPNLTASFNSVNELIDPTVAASGNAHFAINGGTGNDYVNLSIGTEATNPNNAANSNTAVTLATDGSWIRSETNLGSITVTPVGGSATIVPSGNIVVGLGAGNNIVSFNQSGAAQLSAGAGNDTYYVDNSGAKAVWVINTPTTGQQATTTIPAPAAVANATSVGEVDTVTWAAMDLTTVGNETETIGGITVTGTGGTAYTAAQIAQVVNGGAAVAGLAVTYGGTWNVTLTGSGTGGTSVLTQKIDATTPSIGPSGNLILQGSLVGSGQHDSAVANTNSAPTAVETTLGVASPGVSGSNNVVDTTAAGAKEVDTVTWKSFAAVSGSQGASQTIGGVTVTDTTNAAFPAPLVAYAAGGGTVAGLSVTNAGTFGVSATAAPVSTTVATAAASAATTISLAAGLTGITAGDYVIDTTHTATTFLPANETVVSYVSGTGVLTVTSAVGASGVTLADTLQFFHTGSNTNTFTGVANGPNNLYGTGSFAGAGGNDLAPTAVLTTAGKQFSTETEQVTWTTFASTVGGSETIGGVTVTQAAGNAATGIQIAAFVAGGTAPTGLTMTNAGQWTVTAGSTSTTAVSASATSTFTSTTPGVSQPVLTGFAEGAGVVPTAALPQAVQEVDTVTWLPFATTAAGTESIGGVTVTSAGGTAFTAVNIAQVVNGGAPITGLTVSGEGTTWTPTTTGSGAGGTSVFTAVGTTNANLWSSAGAVSTGTTTGSGQVPTVVVTSTGGLGAAANQLDVVTWKGFSSAPGTVQTQTIAGHTVTDSVGNVAFTAAQVATVANGGTVTGLTLDAGGAAANAWTNQSSTTVTPAGTSLYQAPTAGALAPAASNSSSASMTGSGSQVTTNGTAVLKSPNGVYATATAQIGTGLYTYQGQNETVTVSYDGYAKTVPVTSSAGGVATTYTSADVNNAIMTAINGDPVMSKLLHSTQASSGGTVIIDSIIDGAQATPVITFGNTSSATQIAAGLSTGTAGTNVTAAVAAADAANLALQAGFQVARDAGNGFANLTGAASTHTNNSTVTDTGSTTPMTVGNPIANGGSAGTGQAVLSNGANVIDLASGSTSVNSVVLSGPGMSYIENAKANSINVNNGTVNTSQANTTNLGDQFYFNATSYGLTKGATAATSSGVFTIAAAPSATAVAGTLVAGNGTLATAGSAGLVEFHQVVAGTNGSTLTDTLVYTTTDVTAITSANTKLVAVIVGVNAIADAQIHTV